MRIRRVGFWLVVGLTLLACNLLSGGAVTDDTEPVDVPLASPAAQTGEATEIAVVPPETGGPTPAAKTATPADAPPPELPNPPTPDKWALWTDGPHLRGANIWQRVVVPELDGDEFLGNDYVGPPFIQSDFDRLAELGAN